MATVQATGTGRSVTIYQTANGFILCPVDASSATAQATPINSQVADTVAALGTQLQTWAVAAQTAASLPTA